MEFFRIRKDIPFMKWALVFNIISLITFLLAVFFLMYRGLYLSAEFTGGTVLEIHVPQAEKIDVIRNALNRIRYTNAQVQTFGTSHDVLIRLPLKEGLSSAQQSDQIMAALKALDNQIKLQCIEFVGPQVGKELMTDGLLALIFVVMGILIYLACRFKWKLAIAGVIANVHDLVIILGFFAFFRWEFSLSVLAAVLAVLGYSVNESVVIFDRIRETFRQEHNMTVTKVINRAITRTISRTIITHGATQMMVLAILLFGGIMLHNFALALTIGILSSIYSSVFVSAALAICLGIKRRDFITEKN
ncbi:protein translocase subunit SecF [Candidatus Vallotia tarda]|uniref:Protein-export membrane protein SecF n=1 Tax=Candidatus Vallotiella hemipterorum TaxID=1177213 RepID=A0A916NF32_9BURK|nr:protein translocase subunit SecF [Candidatus Vallotia tarda]CAG7599893.1 Protein translocase subunit SecF [Candidatus Vallotia tarda]